MADDHNTKGRVCVTGGTGFLDHGHQETSPDGYSVNATIRIDPERKRDISYLTSLPGASERLQIFNADLDKPETFAPAVEGCIGVFHMAHPLDFEEKEAEDVKVKRVTSALRGILQACADSKTVKRVVYTSSISAVAFGNKAESGLIDESCWTDAEFIRSLKTFGGPYIVTKTLAEKAALDLAEELGLDLVSVIPTWITGPFICSHCPDSVYVSMALILGDKGHYQHLKDTSLVHVDDVARAHIHLLEYTEYQMPTPDSWKDIIPIKFSGLSTKKLQETGFKYENGLEEMFDGAIKCCKEKGLL
ncbi:Vestitone reductase [Sesamum alatum]|uniref:Dihydroflavonol 4-reductase n=1 Tax=Sesamum alatum TaxID=300844 RepID=A0AAE1XWC1_9LAMI|nr:Vestitone reductase [Sesamum alatum]